MNQEKFKESIDVIKEANNLAEKAGTPLFVNFSGGKDSSAVLLLAKEITDKVEAIYMSSGIELPGTIEFVQKEANRLGVFLHITDPVRDYMGDFAFWIRKNGYFPAYGYNYCNSRLKLRPARAYLRKLYGKAPMYRLNGVRKCESTRRSKIYKETKFIVPDPTLSGSFIVYPILEWTSDDVREYLSEKNFSIQKDYSTFGVSGCAYCPYYQPEIYYKILLIYPNIYDKLIEIEKEIGKPAVGGNKFLSDVKEYFLKNQKEIANNLKEKKDKK